MSLFEAVKKTLRRWLLLDQNIESVTEVLDQTSKEFLSSHVAFYAALNQTDKEVFEKRIILFLRTTKVLGNSLAVEQSDRLLVASGAIIPVWKFPNWHYMNLHEVILVPSAFNESSEFNQEDSLIQGMVGSGPMSGKMILSKSALHQGFSNSRDKRNVAIHEFAHLIDMADGDCDGFPERLSTYAFCVPWFDLIYKKIAQIENYKSNINPYGATSKVEFFAVATEYFFERPGLLKKKHLHVYDALKDFYQQDIADIQYSIARDIRPRKKTPCPCGSKKRYKHCCYNNKSDQA